MTLVVSEHRTATADTACGGAAWVWGGGRLPGPSGKRCPKSRQLCGRQFSLSGGQLAATCPQEQKLMEKDGVIFKRHGGTKSRSTRMQEKTRARGNLFLKGAGAAPLPAGCCPGGGGGARVVTGGLVCNLKPLLFKEFKKHFSVGCVLGTVNCPHTPPLGSQKRWGAPGASWSSQVKPFQVSGFPGALLLTPPPFHPPPPPGCERGAAHFLKSPKFKVDLLWRPSSDSRDSVCAPWGRALGPGQVWVGDPGQSFPSPPCLLYRTMA